MLPMMLVLMISGGAVAFLIVLALAQDPENYGPMLAFFGVLGIFGVALWPFLSRYF